MPGREPGAAAGGRGAPPVRSALLRRDSPDVESRRRRRQRPQQVRFQDPVEGGAPGPPPPPPPAARPDTARASPPPGDPPEPAAPGASAARRSRPQAQPLLRPLPRPLPLPLPGKACTSAASQTSPSLQKPFPDPRGHDAPREQAPLEGGPCPGGPAGAGRAEPLRVPGGPTVHGRDPAPPGHPCAPQPGHPCAPLPGHPCAPPPRDPCAPPPGAVGCPAAGCTASPGATRCPRPPARLRGGPPRPASVPCARLPAEPPRLGRSDSEQSLPRRDPRRQQPIPTADPRGLRRPAQGSSQRDPPHPRCGSPRGGPGCAPPAPSPGAPLLGPEKTPAAPDRPGPREEPPEPAAGRCDACSGAQPGGWAPQDPRHAQPCLSAAQSATLRHVQDLLQLVAAAEGQAAPSAGDQRGRAPQGEGAVGPRGPGARGDLRSQLQSLEGVLETSQQTIRVLLDVIQDLEKKEAQRDGRRSYRTGQDIANCGTCRDCACIIYSVEHDFRQQEGRFQRVLSGMESAASPGCPAGGQEPAPASKLPAKLDSKKSRRKCFWFL
ncbi:basic proline-rich protein-like [Dromaius novaehollandiae]|uniref:basic proline-rich protein-like n=1 Tax=Dromaius novaehollandiae TaxID=8790 RepID=UPI00311D3F01